MKFTICWQNLPVKVELNQKLSCWSKAPLTKVKESSPTTECPGLAESELAGLLKVALVAPGVPLQSGLEDYSKWKILVPTGQITLIKDSLFHHQMLVISPSHEPVHHSMFIKCVLCDPSRHPQLTLLSSIRVWSAIWDRCIIRLGTDWIH